MPCTIQIFDGQDKLLIEQQFHSFVGNFIRIMRAAMSLSEEEVTGLDGDPVDVAASYTVPSGGGVSVTESLGWDTDADAGDDTFGVVVGIGTGDTTVGTYKLTTIMEDGTGEDQLSYGATTISGITAGVNMMSFNIVRDFVNSYSSSQVITEVGLYVKMASGTIICVARDLLDSPITLAAYGPLKVVVNIRMNA